MSEIIEPNGYVFMLHHKKLWRHKGVAFDLATEQLHSGQERRGDQLNHKNTPFHAFSNAGQGW